MVQYAYDYQIFIPNVNLYIYWNAHRSNSLFHRSTDVRSLKFDCPDLSFALNLTPLKIFLKSSVFGNCSLPTVWVNILESSLILLPQPLCQSFSKSYRLYFQSQPSLSTGSVFTGSTSEDSPKHLALCVRTMIVASVLKHVAFFLLSSFQKYYSINHYLRSITLH